jgi:hypothetical protein
MDFSLLAHNVSVVCAVADFSALHFPPKHG